MKTIATVVIIVLTIQYVYSQENSKLKKFNPEIFIAGRLMFDYGTFNYLDEPEASFTGSELRRAMLETSGKLSKNIGFKFQVDFARQLLIFKEVNVYFEEIPVVGGRFSIGNILMPFSLEQTTSSKFLTFLERGTPTSYLIQFRTGFLYENFNIWKNRFGFQLAFTANGTEFGTLNHKIEEGQNLSSRISFNAINNEDRKENLHFGISHTNKKPIRLDETNERIYLMAVWPESNLARPSFFYTFENVNSLMITGLEAAYTRGSFSVQGEFVSADVSTKQGNFKVPSYYGFVSYFLTGEGRSRSSNNAFGRVQPKKEFNFKDNWGALELAMRYSKFDMTTVEKGVLNNVAFAMNWYLTSYARVMYNYIYSNNPETETIHMHMMRFQIDFSKRIK